MFRTTGLMLILAVILSVLTAPTLHAQKVKVGVMLGQAWGFSASDNQFVEGGSFEPGFKYGLHAQINLTENERYALLTGLQIYHSRADFQSIDHTYRLKSSIFQLPVLLKLSTNYVNDHNYFGQFGFQLGAPVGDKVVKGPEQASARGLYSALHFGLGYQQILSDLGVTLSGAIYYENGFTNVFEVEGQKFRLKTLGLRLTCFF